MSFPEIGRWTGRNGTLHKQSVETIAGFADRGRPASATRNTKSPPQTIASSVGFGLRLTCSPL